MKIVQYNANQAGVVVGDKVYNIGDALVKAGHVRAGYTMREVVEALANNAAAMNVARDASSGGASTPLASVKLLAPITDPGSLWAAAANYRAHQQEMLARVKTYERTDLSPDDLMAELTALHGEAEKVAAGSHKPIATPDAFFAERSAVM